LESCHNENKNRWKLVKKSFDDYSVVIAVVIAVIIDAKGNIREVIMNTGKTVAISY